MVSMFKVETEGEIVYSMIEERPGQRSLILPGVRLKNRPGRPRSGPVTVFGEGRFIGEGLSEKPDPGAQPFCRLVARDRSSPSARADATRYPASCRPGEEVFSVEVRHIRRAAVNAPQPPRGARDRVYVRHTVAPGSNSRGAGVEGSAIGAATFRVRSARAARPEVVIEESTLKARSLTSRGGREAQWRTYMANAEADPALKAGLASSSSGPTRSTSSSRRIATTRRADEGRTASGRRALQQVMSLRAVDDEGRASAPLLQHIERAARD